MGLSIRCNLKLNTRTIAPSMIMNIPWKILCVTLLAAWYLNEPTPVGFSEPWKLRAYLSVTKIFMDVSWLLEQFGVASQADVINRLLPMLRKTDPEVNRRHITDMVFDGVDVRVYEPQSQGSDPGGYPALVFYHGGGWVLSSAKMYDGFVASIMDGMDMLVISVDYRKAPQHIFPIPFEDCVAATKYFIINSEKFRVDPRRIAIGGDSAGGNLAAAVALKLRDDNFYLMPKLQLLVYPVLQAVDFSLPSMIQNGQGPLLTRYWLSYFVSTYATGSGKYASAIANNEHTTSEIKQTMHATYIRHEDIEMHLHYSPYSKPRLDFGSEEIWEELKDVFLNPYFAPLLAVNVSGLPEAYVYTPHYDILRDEGILYARRLQKAGVPTTHVLGTHAFHGICSYRKLYRQEGADCIKDIVSFLTNKL